MKTPAPAPGAMVLSGTQQGNYGGYGAQYGMGQPPMGQPPMGQPTMNGYGGMQQPPMQQMQQPPMQQQYGQQPQYGQQQVRSATTHATTSYATVRATAAIWTTAAVWAAASFAAIWSTTIWDVVSKSRYFSDRNISCVFLVRKSFWQKLFGVRQSIFYFSRKPAINS